MTRKVALVSGFWAQNIGNAFFNIGGKWILDQVFGEGEVQFVQDHPAYRTFYDQTKGYPDNYVKLHEMLDVDCIVLQGPMLTKNFPTIWGPAFKVFKEKGIKVFLIGAAFFKYTPEEVEAVQGFLKEFPPALISTRDSESYKRIKGLGVPCHDGIDSAFFVPKVFKPLKFDREYLTFNFDRFPEPTIKINSNLDGEEDFSFEELGHSWALELPKFQQYFAKKGKAQAYFGHLIDFRKLPSELAGKMIIRPEHRYTPHMTHKIYQHPNSFVSDEVFTYLSIYAQTSLTLADRVHACVMTLAYGNPAMLFTDSPRQALFARLGLDELRNKPVKLDLDYLEEQRQAELEFLRSVI